MVSVMELYQLLPKTNCKVCGKSTCMAFAAALLSSEGEVSDCTPLDEPKYAKQKEKLQTVMEPIKGAEATGLIIHKELCTGCGNCVVACPVNVAVDPHGAGSGRAPTNDKVILKIEDGVVIASNVQECRRFGKNKILCNGCIVTCPSKAIEFV